MEASPVDALLDEHRAILDYLLDQREVSFYATLESTLPKVILLGAASWLEVSVQAIVREYFTEVVDSIQANEFIKNNALSNRYHQWFDWENRRPGAFFGKFGGKMKKYVAGEMKDDPEFEAQVMAFHELGDLRNQMVHNDYARFNLEKTLDEVRELYDLAQAFADRLPQLLRTDLSDPEEDLAAADERVVRTRIRDRKLAIAQQVQAGDGATRIRRRLIRGSCPSLRLS